MVRKTLASVLALLSTSMFTGSAQVYNQDWVSFTGYMFVLSALPGCGEQLGTAMPFVYRYVANPSGDVLTDAITMEVSLAGLVLLVRFR